MLVNFGKRFLLKYTTQANHGPTQIAACARCTQADVLTHNDNFTCLIESASSWHRRTGAWAGSALPAVDRIAAHELVVKTASFLQ